MAIIGKDISQRILMTGDYYLNSHPGGISAVVNYWSSHFDGLQYYPIYKSGGRLTKGWWFVTSYIRLAFRMLTDRRVRIVHQHTAADGSFHRNSQIVRLCKFFGKKVIMHIHASRFKDFYNEASQKGREDILRTLGNTDMLIVLSESWKEWFASIGIEPEKMTVLHNITPAPTHIPEAKTEDGKVHFLFMGEIGPRKGVFDILKGLAAHKDEAGGKMELRIGGNRNEQQLLDTIRENGLEDMVRFEGWVSGDKKLNLLNWADVYILPSFNEGLPISILEAMSYGCPIISTPVGGIPEVVDDNGVLVTPGNHEEIWKAMERYILDRNLIASEGKVSLENVRTYLPDHVMNHLKEIYLQMLEVKL
ncbi:MAG: glycosyltransferase family 4 protein [Bacteroidales bacterium]|nr:glycosyltransferase family 4 protein [Bacteroidales bacterium]